jgi:hypothetical protein
MKINGLVGKNQEKDIRDSAKSIQTLILRCSIIFPFSLPLVEEELKVRGSRIASILQLHPGHLPRWEKGL